MNIFTMTLIRSGGLPLSAWTSLSNGIPDWRKMNEDAENAADHVLKAFDNALFTLTESPLRTKIYNLRKDFYQRRKAPSDGVVVLLKDELAGETILDAISNWQKTQQAKALAELQFEHNLLENFKKLQKATSCQDGMLLRALLFASHDLLHAAQTFSTKGMESLDKKDRRAAFSLLQYLTRSVFKTSPLGRFTTVQMRSLDVNKEMDDRVGEGLQSKSQVVPNVALLPAIYEVLLKEPAFYNSLNLILNPSVSLTDSKLNYLYFDGKNEAFQQLESDPVIDFVIQVFLDQDRTIPYPKLIETLAREVDASSTQLQSLVFQLIDMGLLEWQLPENGLSSSWGSGLYQYLGFLPSAPVLTEAAYLLQWMRTGARVISFQSLEEAAGLQRETIAEAKSFLEKNGGEMPPIPPEQIFFEDIAQDKRLELPIGTLEALVKDLAACWSQKQLHLLSPFRARLHAFADQFLLPGQSVDFLEFSARFMAFKQARNTPESKQYAPRYDGKLGAMLQVFESHGEYKAVVNAMFPGGGKMFARWLPLFSGEASTQLKKWQDSIPGFKIAFPWQGWSNANFQPLVFEDALGVPDGRGRSISGRKPILLTDLEVRMSMDGQLQLLEKQSNAPVQLVDLGLEAPETRPPVMQILWYLGVPMVSADSLLPEEDLWVQQGEIMFRGRRIYKSLVLTRAAWDIPQTIWEEIFALKGGCSQAERIGLGIAALKSIGIPSLFFGQFHAAREKPQFYDLGSPISMLLLEKNLRGKSGRFRITEMLPTPEQWLGDRVGEFAIEFEPAGGSY